MSMVLQRPRAAMPYIADEATSWSCFGSDAVCADSSVVDNEGTTTHAMTALAAHDLGQLPSGSGQNKEQAGSGEVRTATLTKCDTRSLEAWLWSKQ